MKVTVIFLLYNAEKYVDRLVASLLEQKTPEGAPLSSIAKAVFVDDASTDFTRAKLTAALKEASSPEWISTDFHKKNLGLSKTLNVTLEKITTPYVLTCHLDCLFGTPDYVARMVASMERMPRVGALTGQPVLGEDRTLSFAEKLNMVANLQDVLRKRDLHTRFTSVEPIGFAEGRCDIFRLEALRKAGMYDENLRTAGEDQILAAKLRHEGYEVLKDPSLPYELAVSGEQDTVMKILNHQRSFGQAHPYILLTQRGTSRGISGEEAGGNRNTRMWLRASQLVFALFWIVILLFWPFGRIVLPLLLVMTLIKAFLFAETIRRVEMRPGEVARFIALQPALDIWYSVGLMEGLLKLTRKHA